MAHGLAPTLSNERPRVYGEVHFDRYQGSFAFCSVNHRGRTFRIWRYYVGKASSYPAEPTYVPAIIGRPSLIGSPSVAGGPSIITHYLNTCLDALSKADPDFKMDASRPGVLFIEVSR